MFGRISERIGARRVVAAIAATILVLLSCAVAAALIWPSESGAKLSKKGKLIVDTGNAADGYILCAAKKDKKRLKLRVAYEKELATYDLNGNGDYEVIPLQFGSGTYTVTLYENVSGSRYSEQGKIKFKVKLNDERGALLVPNKWVDYDENSAAVAKSNELCAGLTDDKAKYDAITSYVTDNFMYDVIKSVTSEAGTMPDIDGTLESKKGICQDLSALTVCMLRVQGIHAQMSIGYADESYHAWVITYLDGEELFYDPTVEVHGMGKVKQYTMEHFY